MRGHLEQSVSSQGWCVCSLHWWTPNRIVEETDFVPRLLMSFHISLELSRTLQDRRILPSLRRHLTTQIDPCLLSGPSSATGEKREDKACPWTQLKTERQMVASCCIQPVHRFQERIGHTVYILKANSKEHPLL